MRAASDPSETTAMTENSSSTGEQARANERRRQKYAKEAPRYDKGMDFWERWVFGSEHRGWACSQAVGDTLEVAIGTGLNLPHYPLDVHLTGVDLTPEMLARAMAKANEMGRTIDLKEGDAQNLPLPDHSFDTVVCTYALCSVPDEARAISEMKRVLKPGGRLILVDHVRSTLRPVLWLQRAFEFITSRTSGECMTRRPATHVMRDDFDIKSHDRLRAGIIERLLALKPGRP
jgi:ubiquinone/menaquinone biosynthesis C-methylase UbiE